MELRSHETRRVFRRNQRSPVYGAALERLSGQNVEVDNIRGGVGVGQFRTKVLNSLGMLRASLVTVGAPWSTVG